MGDLFPCSSPSSSRWLLSWRPRLLPHAPEAVPAPHPRPPPRAPPPAPAPPGGRPRRSPAATTPPGPPAPPPPPKAWILVDADTGNVIDAGDAHEPLQPASLTKVITALAVKAFI